MRLTLLLLVVACDPTPIVGRGACEMRYTSLDAHPSPIHFCTEQDAETCDYVQGSHGDADMGFHPGELCDTVGFPVCCATQSVWVCFETLEEADTARLAIADELCVR